MGKQPKIRWTKAQQKSLRQAIKNYNARIKSAEKSFAVDSAVGKPASSILPKLSFKQERARIKTAKELREYVQAINAIRREDIKDIYQTQKQAEQIVNQEQKRREKLKDIDETERLGRFFTARDYLLKGIQDEEGNDLYDKVKNHWLSDEKMEQSERWRQNYLKALQDNVDQATMAGDAKAVDALNQIIDLVTGMDLMDYLIGQLMWGTGVDIIFNYYGNNMDRFSTRGQSSYYDRVLEKWKKVLE